MPPEADSDDLDEMDLDELIEHITVDAYGDEGFWSFLQAFEDHVQYPAGASVVGAAVAVISVDFDGDERRGLVATVERDGLTWTISILDIDISDDQPRLKRLISACRRWLGVGG